MKGNKNCAYCKGDGHVVLQYKADFVRQALSSDYLREHGISPDDPVAKEGSGTRFTQVLCMVANSDARDVVLMNGYGQSLEVPGGK